MAEDAEFVAAWNEAALANTGRWTHKDCGQPVMFDHGGGFCLGCHAEGLDEDDLIAPVSVPGHSDTDG
jgi:hypothetical protein